MILRAILGVNLYIVIGEVAGEYPCFRHTPTQTYPDRQGVLRHHPLTCRLGVICRAASLANNADIIQPDLDPINSKILQTCTPNGGAPSLDPRQTGRS